MSIYESDRIFRPFPKQGPWGEIEDVTSKELHKRIEYRSLRKTVRQLFPETDATPIPDLVEDALSLLVPFCEETTGNPELFLRGSVVKRLVLGTPDGYLVPQKLFTVLTHDAQLVGKSPLADAVVNRIVSGPDIDVMYQKKVEVTDEDIIERLTDWSRGQNTRLTGKGLVITVTPVPLRQWNSEKDERVYSQMTFYHVKDSNKKVALRLDIGQAPHKEQLSWDARLSGYLTSRDILSTAPLRKRSNNHWYVVLEKETQELLPYHVDSLLYKNAPPPVAFINAGRLMYHQLLWPPKRIVESEGKVYMLPERLSDFIIRQYSPFTIGMTHWDIPSMHPTFYWEKISTLSAPLLRPREEDIVAAFVLGMCFDEWQWPLLAYATGVLQFTKLGELFASSDVMEKWILSGVENIAVNDRDYFPPHVVRFDMLSAIARLSDRYQRNLLGFTHYPYRDITRLGPFALVKRLNDIGVLNADVALSTFIDLVNPVSYLREKEIR